MKKVALKIAVIMLSIVSFFLAMTPEVAKAANVVNFDRHNVSEDDTDWGCPVSEMQYKDENGNIIIDRIYLSIDDSVAGINAVSGSGRIRNEKEIHWDNGLSMTTTYYAEGDFVWGNGTVSVSNPNGGYDQVPSNVTVSNVSVSSGTGRYAWIFNEYAYVTFSFTTTNVIGISEDYSVTIRISQSGNNI